MVAPHEQVAEQTSGAEPGTERDFRNIRRDRHKRDASTRQAQHRHQQLAKPRGNSKPLRAGRRSGRPLRGGFVSMRGISGAEPGTERDFRNIRRDRHLRDASTRQAQHRHQQISFPYPHARADAAVRPYAEDCAPSIHKEKKTVPSATTGGMRSERAGSRSFQPSLVASQESFGGCQGGHRSRWSNSRNRCETAPS